MDLKKYKPIITIFIISVVTLVIHKLVFFLFLSNKLESYFTYSLPLLYAFFYGCSAVIILILLKVKEKSIDNVGFTFLLLTSGKMLLSYAFLQPILNSNSLNLSIEKINFFIMFIFFLAVETLVSIRILNDKQ